MIRRGITPNLVCFNTVLHACAHNGDSARAMKWLQRTKAAGISLNKISYNSMIDTYAKAGDNEVAECWLQQMVSNGFHPDHITYVTLLRGCTHMGHDADARWTYGAIIKAYVVVGNLSAVRRWLGEMTKAGFKPSRKFFEELLNICLCRNFKNLASDIGSMMAKHYDARPVQRGQQQHQNQFQSQTQSQQYQGQHFQGQHFQGPHLQCQHHAQHQGQHQGQHRQCQHQGQYPQMTHVNKGVSELVVAERLNALLNSENMQQIEQAKPVLRISTPPGLDLPTPMVHIEHISL